MGQIRKYTCSCGHEQELPIGAGLMGVNTEHIKRSFPEDAVALFQKELDAGNVSNYINENQLGHCPHCGKLIVAPHFHYQLADGTEKHFIQTCPDCGNPFTLINDPDDVTCPKCGSKMEFEDAGSWD